MNPAGISISSCSPVGWSISTPTPKCSWALPAFLHTPSPFLLPILHPCGMSPELPCPEGALGSGSRGKDADEAGADK